MMTAHLNLFLWAILIPSNLPCSPNRIYKNTFLFDPHILNARLYISLYSFLLLYTGIKKKYKHIKMRETCLLKQIVKAHNSYLVGCR